MHALAHSTPSDLAAACTALALPADAPALSPERVLERLLDLPRTVALGAVLDFQGRTAAPPPSPEARAAELARLSLFEARLLRRLDALRADLDRKAPSPRSAARDVDEVASLAMQVQTHLDAAPSDRARAAFAAQLATRYAARPTQALLGVTRELNQLRHELRGALREGCAHSRRLYALDEPLDAALRTELDRCRTRLEADLSRKLADALTAALGALGSHATPDALSPWFAAGGCVHGPLRAGLRFAHTVLDLEWAALMGLLQAALEPLREPPAARAAHSEGTGA